MALLARALEQDLRRRVFSRDGGDGKLERGTEPIGPDGQESPLKFSIASPPLSPMEGPS